MRRKISLSKIPLFFLIGFVLFFVNYENASAVVLNPQFNPLCWKKEECEAVRRAFKLAKPADAADGWLEKDAPCDGDGWGKCLPAGVTVTQVKFGGSTKGNKVADIGEFLIMNYNYLVEVAGILAVIMIIIAAAQWATSGGNSESIGSAKKRIAGAVIGLLIAYLSYVILNTVNPALTKLRLPQVFMIKGSSLLPHFCSQMKNVEKAKFANAGTAGSTLSEDFLNNVKYDLEYKPETFICGNQYLMDGAGSSMCYGEYCVPESGEAYLCTPGFSNAPDQCKPGVIGGYITYKPLLTELFDKVDPGILEGWTYPVVTLINGDVKLLAVCADDDDYQAGKLSSLEVNKSKDEEIYIVRATAEELEKAAGECTAGFRGFALSMQFNENGDKHHEPHMIGVKDASAGDFTPVDLGDYTNKNIGFWDEYNEFCLNISKHTIPLERMKKGLWFDIDAEKIYDVDEDNFSTEVGLRIKKTGACTDGNITNGDDKQNWDVYEWLIEELDTKSNCRCKDGNRD